MSRSPNDEQSQTTAGWLQARSDLSVMIKEGRSFSGHERKCCFLNTGHQRFATVSAATGIDFPDDGRALAVIDWDEDGDLDFWTSNRNAPRLRLMRNDTPGENHHLSLRLVGNGTTTNRDAIGARVEVKYEGRRTKDEAQATAQSLIKTLRAGEGFLAQSTKWVHFGLGDARSIEKVTVRWPAGEIEQFQGLEVDGRYMLEQGSARAQRLPPTERRLVLKPAAQPLPQPTEKARISLVTRLPMPRLTYLDFDGTERRLAVGGGKPVLVNIWASWCRPCLAELKEMTSRASDLKDAGIDVVALAVDGLGKDESQPEAAARTLQQLQFPFTAGRATPALLEDLQQYHNDLILMRRALPLPSSFLVDGQGRLAVIYKGPLAVDELVRDAKIGLGSYVTLFQRGACLPGRALDHPRIARTALESDMRTRYRVASAQLENDRLDDAAAGFLALLEVDPNCTEAHVQMGKICLAQGELDRAVAHCEKVLLTSPDDALVYNTLGLVSYQRREAAQAESYYRRAIELAPGFVEAHNNLGTLLASTGRLDEAAAQFEQALAIDANVAEAHTNLGSVFAARGDYVRAAEQYEEAIRVDPQSADAHYSLGSMYARQGDLVHAAECYERALAIDPNYQQARDNLRRVQQRLGAGR